MISNRSFYKSLLLLCMSLALSSTSLGCGGGSADDSGTGGMIVLDGGTQGCISPVHPASEPDLRIPPLFSSETLARGEPVEGSITVDGETRTAMVELANYWFLDEPPIATQSMQTGGNQTLSFELPTEPDTIGRFFFRITLCSTDCDLSRVVFHVVPDDEDPTLRNEHYERVLYEGISEARRDNTCLPADSISVE